MADEKENTYQPNQFGSVNPETEPKADIPGVEEKRKPGRPPNPAKNTNTNYQPSIERNEEAQAAQPTGTGSTAGYGDWDGVDESELESIPEGWNAVVVDSRMASLVPKHLDSPAPIGEAVGKEALKSDKLFPVRLLRNYVPASPRWYPLLANGKPGKRPVATDSMGNPTPDAGQKVKAGYTILVPLSEAKELVSRGLAQRADAITL